MTDKLIDIDNLSTGYGGAPVVRGLSLYVNPGEVVALLGPNGAGKTTTLLTISGLLRPMEGTVTVLGEPVLGGRAYKVARRGLAHVAEDRSLFFDLTVQENIRLGLVVASLKDDGAGLDVTFSDGTIGRFDLAIGADGLYSTTRQMIMPETP